MTETTDGLEEWEKDYQLFCQQCGMLRIDCECEDCSDD